MSEMILPGVYIDVRAEGLIVPGQITVGNLAVIGTAARGPINTPVLLGTFSDAKDAFYNYDAWVDGQSGELTLTRALEQAFEFGATTVYGLRVAGTGANAPVAATYSLPSATGVAAVLNAATPGTWGNDLQISVTVPALDDVTVTKEKHTGAEVGPGLTLLHHPVVPSSRTSIVVKIAATGVTRSLTVLFDQAAAPQAGQAVITSASGAVKFGDAFAAADTIWVTYRAAKTIGATVTLKLAATTEVYAIVDGQGLIDAVNDPLTPSALVTAVLDAANPKPKELPKGHADPAPFASFSKGTNGTTALGDYEAALDLLLPVDAQIILGAGLDQTFGPALDRHCQQASTDAIRRDRIGFVGSGVGSTFDKIVGNTIDSDRVIFVAPGIMAQDMGASPPVEVTLPGAYAAAAVAGLVASYSPEKSLTNKPLSVDGLEMIFTDAQLTELVQNRVLALEQRQAIKVCKGITTTSQSAFAQITTRRIVDYAKYGVRSAAEPFIGELNNDRVRSALQSSINAFLTDMVNSEMLESYDLSVSATRPDEIRGICRVTMTLLPTFSIDFIQVTMYLG